MLSGGGLTFNGDTAAANALDDYEEGTFVPTTNENLTLHSSYQTWSYTKIGRQVTIRGVFHPSAVSGTDNVYATLPFSAANLTGFANSGGAGTLWTGVTGATAGVSSFVNNSESQLKFYFMTEGTGGFARIANDDISTSTYIYFQHTYFAA